MLSELDEEELVNRVYNYPLLNRICDGITCIVLAVPLLFIVCYIKFTRENNRW